MIPYQPPAISSNQFTPITPSRELSSVTPIVEPPIQKPDRLVPIDKAATGRGGNWTEPDSLLLVKAIHFIQDSAISALL